MEAARRLVIQGLSQPPAPEAAVEATEKLTEVIDAECRELLGLSGACIFSNLQRLCPDLDLLNVLQRVQEATPPGNLERETVAKVGRVDTAIQHLQATYSRTGTAWWQNPRVPPARKEQALRSPDKDQADDP
jgi:hypothetical protein